MPFYICDQYGHPTPQVLSTRSKAQPEGKYAVFEIGFLNLTTPFPRGLHSRSKLQFALAQVRKLQGQSRNAVLTWYSAEVLAFESAL
ncbi:hypothetical protein [Neptuniibacter sp.]|uniref:hypothetical protein n=1 Tax=Neptuniibacter sp. TaxID=1962643 RepID=UPI0026016612|nr:hypothetical protein [Neptuniibacter sp.]MCP4597833.1 hypothetical protein [Neptuniibacter sp.]